jgi:hypothetical protein
MVIGLGPLVGALMMLPLAGPFCWLSALCQDERAQAIVGWAGFIVWLGLLGWWQWKAWCAYRWAGVLPTVAYLAVLGLMVWLSRLGY